MQAPAKLEVEVTNLAAKAGKGRCYWIVNLQIRLAFKEICKDIKRFNF